MRLLPSLRGSLAESIRKIYDKPRFVDFIMENDFGLLYDDVVADVTVFPIGVGQYVDALDKNESIIKLIEALKEKNPGSAIVGGFYDEFTKLYQVVGEQLKLNPEILIRHVLQFEKWLFIARDPISISLAKMINKETQPLLVFTGESQTGRTYTYWYLNEIENQLNNFRVLNLNLVEIGKANSTGTITAAHVAKEIYKKLNIPFESIKDFKFQEFIDPLEDRLEELALKNEYWLFFFDQFDFHHDSTVNELVASMAEFAIKRPSLFYMVFSSYPEWEKDWNPVYCDLADKLEFRSFTKDEVTDYLKKLYKKQKTEFKTKTNEATFIASADLQDVIYNADTGSNVPAISLKLKNWYNAIRKKSQV